MATPSDCAAQNAVLVLLLVAGFGIAAAVALQPLGATPLRKRALIEAQRARLRAQGLAPTVAASHSGIRTGAATVAHRKAG